VIEFGPGTVVNSAESPGEFMISSKDTDTVLPEDIAAVTVGGKRYSLPEFRKKFTQPVQPAPAAQPAAAAAAQTAAPAQAAQATQTAQPSQTTPPPPPPPPTQTTQTAQPPQNPRSPVLAQNTGATQTVNVAPMKGVPPTPITGPSRWERLSALVGRVGRSFRDPTVGKYGDLEKEIIKTYGTKALSEMDADVLGKQFDAEVKKAGVDPNDPDVQITMEHVLRAKNVSHNVRTWAARARAAIDKESQNLSAALRSVGLDAEADAVDRNLGNYLKNVPRATVSPTGRIKEWGRRKLGLTPAFGKTKKDAYIVWDGARPLA
jgi:hypothetical protein